MTTLLTIARRLLVPYNSVLVENIPTTTQLGYNPPPPPIRHTSWRPVNPSCQYTEVEVEANWGGREGDSVVEEVIMGDTPIWVGYEPTAICL